MTSHYYYNDKIEECGIMHARRLITHVIYDLQHSTELEMAMSNSKALEKALTGAVSQVLSQLKRKDEDSSSDDMDDFRPAKKRSATFNQLTYTDQRLELGLWASARARIRA